MNKRREIYGTNAKREAKTKSIFTLVFEQFDDRILQILLVAAAVSLAIGIWQDGIAKGWIEGVTIYIAVAIIITVTAGNNYVKEKQFQKLMAASQDLSMPVVRGGKKTNESIYDLVVGDVVQIKTGD